MKYKVIISYDEEYKGYVVDVPQLPGCVSQGKTIDEALINIKDAIKGWLHMEKKYRKTKITKIHDIFIGEVTV